MSKIHICYVRYVDTTLRLFGKKALTKGCKTGVLLLFGCFHFFPSEQKRSLGFTL